MDGWKTIFILGRPIFRGYVRFREGSISLIILIEGTNFHKNWTYQQETFSEKTEKTNLLMIIEVLLLLVLGGVKSTIPFSIPDIVAMLGSGVLGVFYEDYFVEYKLVWTHSHNWLRRSEPIRYRFRQARSSCLTYCSYYFPSKWAPDPVINGAI